MDKKKSKPKFTSGMVKNALAVLLCLLCLLFLLSPGTHLSALAYGGIFLFGTIFFYLFFAFFFFVGFFFPFRGKVGSLPKRFYFVLALSYLGIGLLANDLAFSGAEDPSLPSSFLDILNSSFAEKGEAMLLDPCLFGGFPLYELAGLLAIPGRFLPLLVASLCLFPALLIAFFPLLKKAVLSLRAKAAVSKAKHPEKREKKRQAKQEKKRQEVEIGKNEPDLSFEQEQQESKEASAQDRQNLMEQEKQELESWQFLPSSKLPYSSRKQYRQENPSPSLTPADPSSALFGAPIQKNKRVDELQEATFPFSAVLEEEQKANAAPSKENTASQETSKVPEALRPRKKETPLKEASFPLFEEKAAVEASKNECAETPLAQSQKTVPPVMPEIVPTPEPAPVEEDPKPQIIPEKPVVPPTPAPSPIPSAPTQAPSAPKQPENPGEDATPLPPYVFPDASLLKDKEEDPELEQKRIQEAENNKAIIDETLAGFGVGARVVSYQIGPSVTRFDVQVDPSVQVTSLSRYETDVSAHLAGLPTRFVPIVQNKTTSAFEIGNRVRQMVPFKEVFEALPNRPVDNLVVPFGKSIDGNLVYGDLSQFPHMLVCGATGSGKSVFIHGMLLSLLMRNRPEDLRLVMVDPKCVEFVAYEGLPNLLCPIITDPKQAEVALNKLCDLMDRRFALLAKARTRDIRSYNDYYAPAHNKKKLPYIVVVVDEFGDLAMNCKNIADPIQRIGQKARAAGIHLIIATQHPDAETISGVIKSNLKVTVCLMVKDVVASQVALKQKGGEQLLDHGDMLVDCAQLGKSLVRCQGCFVDEHVDLTAVPDFIRSQMGTNYDPEFLDLSPESQESTAVSMVSAPSSAEIRAAQNQDKYEMIKAAIMQQESTSISQIQRNFGVGFPRAGKIIAQLQAEGIVAKQSDAPGSSKGFKVLIHVDPNPGGFANGQTPGSASSATTSYSEE